MAFSVQVQNLHRNQEIRMVLIGKTGSGKSASGNSILGQQVFESASSPSSVTSECAKARRLVAGRSIAVIDTPGIYDTKYSEEEVFRKLRKCISLSAPGPHVFLIVIKLDRFTKEDMRTVELLQLVFGDKAADYSMVLFTNGEQLGKKTIEDFFRQSPELSQLITNCKYQYHVFSNSVPNRSQVLGLLAKIDRMVSKNAGTFYTNQMFQAAERAIQEKTKRILMANEEQKRRAEENLKAKFQGQQLQAKQKLLQEEYEQKAREKAEKKNKYIEPALAVAGAEMGIAIGGAAATVGGPVCMAAGALLGGIVGATVGAFSPAAVKALKNKCSMQ